MLSFGLSLSQMIGQIIIGIVSGVVGILIAQLALATYFKRRQKPKVKINAIIERDPKKFGFEVQSKNRTLKDARVRCNDITYNWEDKTGREFERKDIFVGDEPSRFFPFVYNLKTTLRQAIGDNLQSGIEWEFEFELIETTMQKIVHTLLVRIPKDSKDSVIRNSNSEKEAFAVTLRLIGEQIEELRDYNLVFSINYTIRVDNDKPSAEVNYEFIPRLKH